MRLRVVLLSLLVVGVAACYPGPHEIAYFEGQTFTSLDDVDLECGPTQTLDNVYRDASNSESESQVLDLIHAELGEVVYSAAERAGNVWLLVWEDGSVQDALQVDTGSLKFCSN